MYYRKCSFNFKLVHVWYIYIYIHAYVVYLIRPTRLISLLLLNERYNATVTINFKIS